MIRQVKGNGIQRPSVGVRRRDAAKITNAANDQRRIHQPSGSAKRDPTSERFRATERRRQNYQRGKRPTEAGIHQPRGCANRGPTSERWRIAGRVALPCPQAKARRLPPYGGALRAINFSRLASLRLVCYPVSDQRERRFTKRAGARNGFQRPSGGASRDA